MHISPSTIFKPPKELNPKCCTITISNHEYHIIHVNKPMDSLAHTNAEVSQTKPEGA